MVTLASIIPAHRMEGRGSIAAAGKGVDGHGVERPKEQNVDPDGRSVPGGRAHSKGSKVFSHQWISATALRGGHKGRAKAAGLPMAICSMLIRS